MSSRSLSDTVYKLEPKARVCVSDKDRMRIDPSYEFIGEVILKINIV